jgi:hypothetical protein
MKICKSPSRNYMHVNGFDSPRLFFKRGNRCLLKIRRQGCALITTMFLYHSQSGFSFTVGLQSRDDLQKIFHHSRLPSISTWSEAWGPAHWIVHRTHSMEVFTGLPSLPRIQPRVFSMPSVRADIAGSERIGTEPSPSLNLILSSC